MSLTNFVTSLGNALPFSKTWIIAVPSGGVTSSTVTGADTLVLKSKLAVAVTEVYGLIKGSMEHLNEKLRYNRLLKNRNADLTAFLFFLDFKAPKLSGTIERKVAVSL